MKRLLMLVLLVCPLMMGQTTPNIGLNTPNYGAQNWNVQLNANFTTLDNCFGGALCGTATNPTFLNPIFSITTATQPTFKYQANSVLQINVLPGQSGQAAQAAAFYFQDQSTGSPVTQWQVGKDSSNNYTVSNSPNNATLFQLKSGTNGNSFLDASGSGFVGIGLNNAITTGGVKLGHGNSSTADVTVDSSGHFNVITGWNSNGGFQFGAATGAPLCTASSGVANTCTYAFTWPTSFNNTSYRPSCSVTGFTGTGKGFVSSISITAVNTMTITFVNVDGSNAYTPTIVSCTGAD